MPSVIDQSECPKPDRCRSIPQRTGTACQRRPVRHADGKHCRRSEASGKWSGSV